MDAATLSLASRKRAKLSASGVPGQKRMKRGRATSKFELTFSFCSFLLFLVNSQELFEYLGIEFAIGKLRPELAFELIVNIPVLEDFDFINEPIQPEAQRGVRNAVGISEFLQGAGKEDKALDKSQILVLEGVHPPFFFGIAHLIKCKFTLKL
jgi:hypothetical protein